MEEQKRLAREEQKRQRRRLRESQGKPIFEYMEMEEEQSDDVDILTIDIKTLK